MIKNRVLYLVFLASAVYLAILFDRYPTFLALALIIFVPLLSGVCIPFWKRGMHIKLSVKSGMEEKGDETAVFIKVKNRSPFPIINGVVELHFAHQLDEKDGVLWIPFTVDAFGEERIRVPVTCEYCGLLTFSCEKVRIVDYFGLFAYKKKIDLQKSIVVLPKLAGAEEVESFLGQQEAGDEKIDEYAELGTDTSNVREYRPGDSLKRIHWKISGKKKKLMTREFENETGERQILTFAFLYEEDQVPDIEWYDETISGFVKKSQGLLYLQCSHEVIWYHPKSQLFLQSVVEEEADLLLVAEQIIRAGIGKMPEEYQQELEHYLMAGLKNQ